MRTLGKAIVAGLALVTFGFMPAAQASWFSLPRGLNVEMGHVIFKRPVAGPFAYARFCVRHADDCREHGHAFRRPAPVILTESRLRQLISINQKVNRAITPKRYINDTSFDTWQILPKSGDCNDYAISKRHALLAMGWPSRALLLSEVITSWGEHHLVLLVRTDRQDFVLDNLNANVRVWSSTPYQWVRVQSPGTPNLWSTIEDPSSTTIS